MACMSGARGEHPRRMLKKARLLTRPTLAVISPSRPESVKTDSSPWDAPYPMQGRSSEADPRFTFHASRFTILGSEARTMLADFFSILLGQGVWIGKGEVGNMVGDTGIEPVASSV